MVNLERLKTVSLYEKKDPVRDLWRNVLIVGIEDLIKKKKNSKKIFCLGAYDQFSKFWPKREDPLLKSA